MSVLPENDRGHHGSRIYRSHAGWRAQRDSSAHTLDAVLRASTRSLILSSSVFVSTRTWRSPWTTCDRTASLSLGPHRLLARWRAWAFTGRKVRWRRKRRAWQWLGKLSDTCLAIEWIVLSSDCRYNRLNAIIADKFSFCSRASRVIIRG